MKEEPRLIFTSKERRALQKMRKTLSEAELAVALNVTACTIGRWLRGDYTPPFKSKILIIKMFEEYNNG